MSCRAVRRPARRDPRDVPDHRAGRIEVRRADQELAALARFGRDPCHFLVPEVLVDQPAKSCRVHGGIARQCLLETTPFGEVRGRVGRIHLAQAVVVFGPQEGERCDGRTRAHAGDDLEFRPGACSGPTDQQSRAESTVDTAARDDQVVVRPVEYRRTTGGQPFVRWIEPVAQHRGRIVAPVTHIGRHPWQAGLVGEFRGQRVTQRRRGAADQRHAERCNERQE